MTNKVVIITGASSGIGLACARECSMHGMKVVLAARNQEKLKEIEKELLSKGAEAMAVPTDVTSEEECKNLVDQTLKRFGTIDVLINNAGISMRALFNELDLKVIKHLMDVNFWGTVYCTKYALPCLLKNKGSVVGISSIAGFKGLPGRTGYSASKFAMNGFLESLRIENLKTGLHVMIVAPGFTASNIRRTALGPDGHEQGTSPRDENKLMPAGEVAHRIYKGLVHRRRNIIFTLEGKVLVLVHRIIPHIVDYLAYKEMASEPNSPFK
ncbi:MAG: SDR family oxidoreductase [Bacteroidota bacterium]|nr:SDR family oxidoreductase [Bacteroidota bacterium]